MTTQLSPLPVQRFYDNNNNPLSGGQLWTYQAGTSTPQATYTDSTGGTANANPVVMNARGEANVWLTQGQAYKFVLKDASSNTIWTTDQIIGGVTSDFLTNLANTANMSQGVALVGGASRVVATIAALRTLPKTGSPEAFVTGYYAQGDGGGGAYYYDSADTSSSDNGGSIIVASDGGRWKLVHFGTVTVKQFGAKGDGVANDIAAINAAIAANPGQVIHFPAGTYSTNASIVVSASGTKLKGDALWGVQISCTTLNTPIINITAQFGAVESLSVIYAGTPVAGASAIYVNNSSVNLINFVTRNGYNGVEITSLGVGATLTNFSALNYVNVGVLLTDVNDVFIHDFIINAGSLTLGALGGIRLFGNVQALVVQSGDVLSGVYGMTTGSTTNTYNARPSYNKFTNVFFDSGNNGAYLTNTVATTFDSCWFASTKSGYGVQLTSCDTVVFQKCQIINNWQHGAVVQSGCSRIVFEACQAISNGQQTSATYHGILITAGISDFRIQGCIAGNQIGFNATQQFGIIVASGGSDRYIVADNLINNNLSSGVSDAGTGVNKRVANNY
jgi:hypothetical protein